MRAQIVNGTLPMGARAPSTRALAAELGVSRTKVTAFYEQLAGEGFLVTAAGRAARVASALAPAVSAPVGRGSQAVAPLSAFGVRVEKMALSVLPGGEPPAIDFLYGAIATSDFLALAWRRAHLSARSTAFAAVLRAARRRRRAAPRDAALSRARPPTAL